MKLLFGDGGAGMVQQEVGIGAEQGFDLCGHGVSRFGLDQYTTICAKALLL
jgi:hypothetical protein